MRPRPSARVRANRANALRSTGPKTSAGKAKSSRNALVHGLCAAPEPDSPVEDLTAFVAGDHCPAEGMNVARSIAQADATARRARQFRAVAFDRLVNDNPADKSLVEIAGSVDSVMAEVLDPEARAHIRGAAPVDSTELRLVSRITRFAARLRTKQAAEVLRKLARLDLYEKRALALRARAVRELIAIQNSQQA